MTNHIERLQRLALAALLAGMVTTIAPAQDAADDAPPPATDDAPPSLDDLLGIDEDEPDEGAEDAAERERREALDSLLSEQEVVQGFEAAIAKMALSAELLDEHFDPGLGTQRVQEDILAKLDALIEDAMKKSRNNSSSSSSSSSSQRSSESQQSPPQRDGQREQGNREQPNASDSNDSQEAPPAESGPLNNVIDENRIEWGSLPERVRGMIQQGLRDRASSLYRQLTEEYYRRIADEVSS